MYGVVANVVIDKQLRNGAKVYILYCHGMARSPKVFGIARGGRRIEKYISYKKLNKFRAQWLPEHIRSKVVWKYVDRRDAERFAKSLELKWTNVRLLDEVGNIIREGIPESEADNIVSNIKFVKKEFVFSHESIDNNNNS
ncbi:hypothetical protein PAALTS15_15821 [Paenibacillus alvei TS-15]|uniref:Uncharacterized protein n=1 Tax=Paenibacillus alvei TS-15 TaxID=1117108 RepID=S9SK93_PAEAL|nr:hypothetical protein [Paenibacillus alvei]EPY06202.1 hypothetical protein PAALTS15_15821 [Paenibacillus alvei TS-15]